MDNYILLKWTSELEELSKALGFTKTYFMERDLILVSGSKKEILQKSQQAKQKKLLVAYEAEFNEEEKLRFVLEKTSVDLVFGVEKVHSKDSLHFLRGGLDQVLCTIAAERGKMIGFSFAEILNSQKRALLMGRMMLNFKLCRKYKLKTVFSNFSREKMELRSAQDLGAFEQVLGGK